jgi:hypothetical protein
VKKCLWGSLLALVLGPELGPKRVPKTMSPNSWGTSFSTLFLGRNLGPKWVPRNHTAYVTKTATPVDQDSATPMVLNQNPSQPVHFGKRPAHMIPKADPPITRSQHVSTLQCKSRHREYKKQGVCQSGNPSMPREERTSMQEQVWHTII